METKHWDEIQSQHSSAATLGAYGAGGDAPAARINSDLYTLGKATVYGNKDTIQCVLAKVERRLETSAAEVLNVTVTFF